MKRMILLILSSLLFLCGCSNKTDMENPCNFYYLKREIVNTGENSVIEAQIKDSTGLSVQELISQYLSGRPDAKLVSPFPAGMRLIDYEQEERRIRVTVSDGLASLSGVDLTLAWVCLGRTCFELTEADSIEIRCQTEKLNGNESITLTRDAFSLQDTFLPDTNNTNTP